MPSSITDRLQVLPTASASSEFCSTLEACDYRSYQRLVLSGLCGPDGRATRKAVSGALISVGARGSWGTGIHVFSKMSQASVAARKLKYSRTLKETGQSRGWRDTISPGIATLARRDIGVGDALAQRRTVLFAATGTKHEQHADLRGFTRAAAAASSRCEPRGKTSRF